MQVAEDPRNAWIGLGPMSMIGKAPKAAALAKKMISEYNPADIVGNIGRELVKTRKYLSTADPEELVTVYHGVKPVPSGQRMGGNNFYVSKRRDLIEGVHGPDIRQITVPRSAFLPDPEKELYARRKLTGAESIESGDSSAMLPGEYFNLLTKAE